MIDVGLGGIRVYSDGGYAPGARLEIDLLGDHDEGFVTCMAEVVWIREIEGGQPAHYDVGLRFLDIPAAARATIESLTAKALEREAKR